MKRDKRRSDCPVSVALDIFGDKWTLLIVRDLLFSQKKYYGDFLNSGEGIATNILADRLDKLEHAGVVAKAADPRAKNRIIYSLTPKGIDLLPMLTEMILWSATYDPHIDAPKKLLDAVRTDKRKFIRDVRASLKQKA